MKQIVVLLVASSLTLAAHTKQSLDHGYFNVTSLEDHREPNTTEDYDTTTTAGLICPLGWIDGDAMGCFLFSPEMAGLSWIEAFEYCEEQV